MKINIRGDKVVITDGIRDYVNTKILKLEKYFSNHDDIKTNVVIRVRGRNQKIEVTIPTNQFTLRAEESHNDLYSGIDLVIDKLERQIRKNKTRIEKKIHKDEFKELNYNFISEMVDEESTEIVKRKKIEMKPMDEEEAILQMNLIGHTFFIFKDIESENVCVVYKRKDNDYGIIEVE